MPTTIEIPDELFELLRPMLQQKLGIKATENGWVVDEIDYIGGGGYSAVSRKWLCGCYFQS